MTETLSKELRRIGITVSKPILAVICLIFGIVIIVKPDILGIVVGIFLIIEGVLLLTDYFEIRKQNPPPPPP